MKTKLLFAKKKCHKTLSVLLLLLGINNGWCQQIIGEFTSMDGGFEGQVATTSLASIASSGTPSTTDWSVSSSGNSEVRTISNLPANARTGDFSAALALKTTANNTRLQSPTPTSPTFLATTEYTVQYFYKTDTDPGTYLAAGIYLNSTTAGVASTLTNATPFALDTWTKAYSTITSGGTYNALNWAVARISTSPNVNLYNATVKFDDFVVYAGAYDNAAPSGATDGLYVVNANTATISWTPPTNSADVVNGLIGGGYVVVRYNSVPNNDNDPNQNGIYKIGNTTSNGTANLLGTIAYIGSDTMFSETYLPGTYYKIYAVDKAFNYSEEIVVADPALNIAQNVILDLNTYPNPVRNTLFIESKNNPINLITIYSIDGKEVLKQSSKNIESIDVSNLSSGIYVMKLASGNTKLTKKLIVK